MKTRNYFGISVSSLAVTLMALAQTEPAGVESRGLQSQVFQSMRANAPPAQPAAAKSPPPKKAAPKQPPAQSTGSFLGFTLWKMVLAPPNAPVKSRGFVHPVEDRNGSKDWTAQRITLDRPVHPDDYVRFTFECGPQGYLYVFDRDAFSDGSLSEPVLIYPTKRIRGGQNEVLAGHPVQIPDPLDNPPALQVDPPKPGQTGILLIVIATPQPLPEIKVGDDQQKISEVWLNRWEKQWAANVDATSDAKLDGLTVTMAEQAAVSDPSKPLSASDILPVTLFHRQGAAGQGIYVSALIKLESK